jgi:hypothetical protein
MTCMDNVPEDVMHYEIMPYLNYEERINFNQALKPIHRKKDNKINESVKLKHAVRVAGNEFVIKAARHTYYKDMIDNLIPTHSNQYNMQLCMYESLRAIIEIFKKCMKDEMTYVFIMLTPLNKRRFIELCCDFSEEARMVSQYSNYDRTMIGELATVSKQLLAKLLEEPDNLSAYKKILGKDTLDKTNLLSIMELLV